MHAGWGMRCPTRAILLVAVVAFLPPALPADDAAHSLSRAQPAQHWNEALSITNGRFSALILGGVPQERIRFLLSTTGNASSVPGEVHLTFPKHEHADDYQRELDSRSGVARTTYRVDEIMYRRTAFLSEQVFVLHAEADHRLSLSFTLSTDTPHTNVQSRLPAADTLLLEGTLSDGQTPFAMHVKVVAVEGRIDAETNAIKVVNANSAVVLVSGAAGANAFEQSSRRLSEATQFGVHAILTNRVPGSLERNP
jgi:hypothetical protein